MKLRKLLVVAVAAFALSGCATVDGDTPSFMEGLQQGLGAAAMAVGTLAGDSNLANQGAEAFERGRRNDSAR